jgi:hypothetical protein
LRIDPNYPPHQELRERVDAHLRSLGYQTQDLTYAVRCDTAFRDALQKLMIPSALYLRGWADGWAIHEGARIGFAWEAKTHAPRVFHDGCFEALPLAYHLSRVPHRVDCLYAYNDPYHPIGGRGFWVSRLPPLREICLQTCWEEDPGMRNYFLEQFARYFPCVPVQRVARTRGSNDPYAIIDVGLMAQLPPWQDLIDELHRPGRDPLGRPVPGCSSPWSGILSERNGS